MAAPSARPDEDFLVDACLATLRSLGPAVKARLQERPAVNQRVEVDGTLHVSFGRGMKSESFVVRMTRTNLSYALVAGFIERARASKTKWMVFAPYVSSKIGQHLIEHGISYVDTVGNCHLESLKGRQLLAHVEGKKPHRASSEGSGGRVPSYQLLFAILAQPGLLEQPVRQIATAAGIGKTAAAAQLKRLADQQLIRRTPSGGTVLRERELRQRWLSAYADIVRPAWLLGRYRTQESDPELLAGEIERLFADQTWAFGGGAAAWRMTQLYRGPATVLHVAALPPDMLRQLRAIPAQDGALTILRTPGTVAYAGTGLHLAHPLLVYTELASQLDPRMNEAAHEIWERFLEPT